MPMAVAPVRPRRPRAEAISAHDGAFSAAVREHHRDLARFAYLVCGDRNHAEDVVAEVFTRAWPRWRRGQIDALLPYVRRSIVHEIHGRGRRKVLERREEQRRRVAGPDGRFEDRVDQRHVLWPLLARLPVAQRVVVVLRIVEDLSEEETATLVGVPTGTVKSRLSRALATLRSMLEDHDG
jgi:RNA polymerase sigma-70 factor (sigma-E family)